MVHRARRLGTAGLADDPCGNAGDRYFLENRHVVLDHRSLAHDQPSGVIEENPASDAYGRVDVRLEHRRRSTLEIVGEILAALVPQPVGKPMGLDGMKAFEVEHRLEK